MLPVRHPSRSRVLIKRARAPRTAQPHVEGAGAAVTHGRLLEADDERPEVRQAQPVRHHPAQNAALLERNAGRARGSLAGDDKDDLEAGTLRAVQESAQRPMRIILAQAV